MSWAAGALHPRARERRQLCCRHASADIPDRDGPYEVRRAALDVSRRGCSAGGLHSPGMAFRWFRRRPAPAPDPIAAYDDLVSDLSGEAAELRRAAVTLLTVRTRLGRELAGGEQVARTLHERSDRAR